MNRVSNDPMELVNYFILLGVLTFMVWLWFILFDAIHGKRTKFEQFLAKIVQFLFGFVAGIFWINLIVITTFPKLLYDGIFFFTLFPVIICFWIARKRWKELAG
jgi:hypothetical protein